MEAGQSTARFGTDVLVLRCNRDAGAIMLSRSGSVPSGEVPMTILTSSSAPRPLNGSALESRPGVVTVAIAARDPILDAMAFSRGRFAIETMGLPTLYVPSWSEVSRVVEDCR